MTRHRHWVAGVGGLLVAMFASAAHAQPVKVELSALGGASTGMSSPTDAFVLGLQIGGVRSIAVDEGSGLEWVAGVGVGVGLSERLLLVGEYISNRIANPSITGTVGRQSVSMKMRATLADFTGGVQYLFSSATKGAVPYVGGGAGLVRLTIAVDSTATALPLSAGESDVSYNVGGGVRIFTSDRWGFRPDARVVHIPGETYVRASVGAFYQIR